MNPVFGLHIDETSTINTTVQYQSKGIGERIFNSSIVAQVFFPVEMNERMRRCPGEV